MRCPARDGLGRGRDAGAADQDALLTLSLAQRRQRGGEAVGVGHIRRGAMAADLVRDRLRAPGIEIENAHGGTALREMAGHCRAQPGGAADHDGRCVWSDIHADAPLLKCRAMIMRCTSDVPS